MDRNLIYWSNGDAYEAFANACIAQAASMKKTGIGLSIYPSQTGVLFCAGRLGQFHISAHAQFGYLAPIESNILATALLFGTSRQNPLMIVVLDAYGKLVTTARKRDFLLSMIQHLDADARGRIMSAAYVSRPPASKPHSSFFPEEQFAQPVAITFA